MLRASVYPEAGFAWLPYLTAGEERYLLGCLALRLSACLCSRNRRCGGECPIREEGVYLGFAVLVSVLALKHCHSSNPTLSRAVLVLTVIRRVQEVATQARLYDYNVTLMMYGVPVIPGVAGGNVSQIVCFGFVRTHVFPVLTALPLL